MRTTFAAQPVDLSSVEAEAIEFFARNAQRLSLPRSLGELFGLLFASAQPLPFEVFAQKLALSRGSVSTGLRHLQRLGAVKTTLVPGDRRTFYEAETSLRKVITTFVESTIRPALDENEQALIRLTQSLEREPNPIGREVLRQRLSSLSGYQRTFQQLIPLLAIATDHASFATRLLALQPKPEGNG